MEIVQNATGFQNNMALVGTKGVTLEKLGIQWFMDSDHGIRGVGVNGDYECR